MVLAENSSAQQGAIVEVAADQVSVCCEGPGGALGHPAVHLSMEGKAEVRCYYCGRIFKKATK